MATAQDTTLTATSRVEHAAWTVDALRAVWERQRERVNDRIDTIDRAVAALASDRLDAGLAREAERAAHMLAGSLGMFGFLDASQAAHDLEAGLLDPTPDDAPMLAARLMSVRYGVLEPVVCCRYSPPSHHR